MMMGGQCPTGRWVQVLGEEALTAGSNARRPAVLDVKVSVDVAVRHMPEKALCAPEGAVISIPD